MCARGKNSVMIDVLVRGRECHKGWSSTAICANLVSEMLVSLQRRKHKNKQ
jgi:hypothetical protein